MRKTGAQETFLLSAAASKNSLGEVGSEVGILDFQSPN